MQLQASAGNYYSHSTAQRSNAMQCTEPVPLVRGVMEVEVELEMEVEAVSVRSENDAILRRYAAASAE